MHLRIKTLSVSLQFSDDNLISNHPPPGLFPSPLLKHFAPVSVKMTLSQGEGGEEEGET